MRRFDFLGWLHRHADRTAKECLKGFDPADLALEDYAEIARDGFADSVQVERFAEFLPHRSHGLGRDAAGDDQVEIAEIGVYVECEAVGGDEAGDMDADGGEFCFGASVRGGAGEPEVPRLRRTILRIVLLRSG